MSVRHRHYVSPPAAIPRLICVDRWELRGCLQSYREGLGNDSRNKASTHAMAPSTLLAVHRLTAVVALPRSTSSLATMIYRKSNKRFRY
jgi:hypothetical protein